MKSFKEISTVLSREISLEQKLGDRENNLTPIRLILAWMVLFGHSYAIYKIPGVNDPISTMFNHTWIGAIAVELFFALSGMLIAKSFVDRSVSEYIISRILRIYPALIACVLVTVFIMGPIISTASVQDYFRSPDTYAYLKNATLLFGIEWYLPGFEFEGRRIPANGSLWTLPVEVRCYVILMVLGMFGAFRSKLLTIGLAVLLTYIAMVDSELIPLVGHKEKWLRPCYYFLLGALAYQFAQYIKLSWRTCILAVILIVIFNNADAHWHTLAAVPLVYIALCIGYLTPFLNWDRKIGDLSYGTYVYAWPVQVFCFAVLGAKTPVKIAIYASIITLTLAWLSWRFIEKPSLNLKKKIIKRRPNLS